MSSAGIDSESLKSQDPPIGVQQTFHYESLQTNLEGGDLGDLSKMAQEELDALTQDSRTTVGLVDIEGDTKRFQTSQQLQFTPFKGFTAKATVGVDYRFNVEQETESPAFNEQIGNDPTLSNIRRVERRFLGLTLEGTAQYQFTAGDFSFVSTAGGQVFRDEDDQSFLAASNIAQGSSSINNAACAFIYLSKRLDEYVATEQARQGRWLLHNVVIEALLYKTARLIRIEKLEKIL